jgi:phasin family protein
MSTVAPEQFVAAQKAGVVAAFGILESGFKGFEKLVELNLQATKSALAETQAVVSEAVSTQAPQSFFELLARQSPAAAEKLQAYFGHANEIVADTRNELLMASEKQVADYVRESKAIFENLVKNAPPGAEHFAALWKTGFKAAQEAGAASFAQATAATKQTMEVIDKAGKTVASVKAA